MALTTLSPESGNEFVDAFINNGRHYINPVDVTGPFVIGYYFGKQTGTVVDGTNYGYEWRPFEKAAYSRAVQGWEHIANIDFQEVTTQASALFVERLENQATATGTVSASHSLPSANVTAQSQGNYNFEAVGIRQWTPDTLEPGGNFFRTFIHETGHGLGLKHPHDNGSGAFSPNLFPGLNPEDPDAVQQRDTGLLGLNHMFGSVMSYDHGYVFDANGIIDEVETRQRPVADDYFLDHGFAATPMAYDVAAVQYLYGANTTYASGNNVYVLPDSNDPRPFVEGPPNPAGLPETIVYQPDTAFWSCIWDTGGTDEMRYDGSRNAILDLTAATLDATPSGYGVLSYAAFIGGGYTIANGVVVENATGGEGNDTIVGNAVANLLVGRGGNDTIAGRSGADVMTGGIGNDVFKDLASDLDGDTITDFALGDTIFVTQDKVTSASVSGGVMSFIASGVTRHINVGTVTGPGSVLSFKQVDGGSTIQYGYDSSLFGTLATDFNGPVGQVYALYDAVLGRQPDALGLEQAVAALRMGVPLRDYAASLIASAEGQAKLGSGDNASFVDKLYQTALGRVADDAGRSTQVGFLDAGGSRADLAIAFATSDENLTGLTAGTPNGVFAADKQVADVARLYYGVLSRAPDATGLASLVQAAQAGAMLETLAAGMLGSAEYQGKFGMPNDVSFVKSLYQGALGRDPSLDASTWTTALAGGVSRASVATGISESDEAKLFSVSRIEVNYVTV